MRSLDRSFEINTAGHPIGAPGDPGGQRISPAAQSSSRLLIGAAPKRRSGWTRFAFVPLMAFAAGATVAGYLGLISPARMLDTIENKAIAAGFGISQVSVTGARSTKLTAVFNALQLDQPASFLTFDTRLAKQRLLALPWVAQVKMIHILPDTLAVQLRERRVFALWRNNGRYQLIDRDGRVLGNGAKADRSHQPVIAGSGAALLAHTIIVQAAHYPDVYSRIDEIERVGDRRWTLHMRNKVQVLLPARGVAGALKNLAALQANEKLLDRMVVAIDLRVFGQVRLRLPRALARRRGRKYQVDSRIQTNTGRRASLSQPALAREVSKI